MQNYKKKNKELTEIQKQAEQNKTVYKISLQNR